MNTLQHIATLLGTTLNNLLSAKADLVAGKVPTTQLPSLPAETLPESQFFWS